MKRLVTHDAIAYTPGKNVVIYYYSKLLFRNMYTN